MAQKKIHIVWQDGRTIDIRLEDNPVAEYYYNCIKHLQHIDLEFNARKNPLQAEKTSRDSVVAEITKLCKVVDINIDVSRLEDQKYLNELHEIYFNNAKQINFDSIWLKIHDCIHLLENFNDNGLPRNSVWFDYENKAGLLIKPFDRSYFKYSTTEILAGMCFIGGHELGKVPELYRQHGEPLNIQTMCAQSKPWLLLKPVLNIAVKSSNEYKTFDRERFNRWFAPFRDDWCKHWSIPDWDPIEMFSKIPIGSIDNLSEFINCFSNLDYPKRLAL